MAVIRPFNPPVVSHGVTPQQPAQPAARPRGAAEAKAAQRAFFQQALGDPTPVRAAPTPTSASLSQPAPPAREVRRPVPEEPPAKVMRPGSFIDIKV